MPPGEKCLPVNEFIALSVSIPVVDVRSPGEYAYGHMPGAVNIPLFTDDQRAEVGTIYKNKGSTQAVLRGIDLAAPGMSSKLSQALSLARNRSLLVYCWRGGMRSEAMAWLFSIGGLDALRLEKGYKAYRNHVLNELGKERKYIVLGGLTGSGKTGILKHMLNSGTQVTDLEAIASHRGSAFGALGQLTQPSSEHFANMLFDDLRSWNEDKPVWLEDESRNIGSVFMPDCFWEQMQRAPVIALMMSAETRLPRLLEEYTAFPAEQIAGSIMKISKRLGGDRTRKALDAVDMGDFATAIRITLDYYDRSYNYSLSKRPAGQVTFVHTDTDDLASNAAKVLDAARKINRKHQS